MQFLVHHLIQLDRPGQHQQFLAQQPLHGIVADGPAATLAAQLFQPAVQLLAQVGRNRIPAGARKLGAQDGFGPPFALFWFGRAAEYLVDVDHARRRARDLHQKGMLLVNVGYVKPAHSGCLHCWRSKSSPSLSANVR